MQLFIYHVTDLATFDSPPTEVWMDEKDISTFAADIARQMRESLPALVNKGICVAIYDDEGEAIKYLPLDPLH
jgi:hypothetical protein